MRMRLLFLILPFLWITSSSFSQSLNPYFKDFYLEQTKKEVAKTLENYKASFIQYDKKNFRMDFPLFFYLKSLAPKNNFKVDFENKRIYVDNSYFFDFQETVLRKKNYDFFYKDPYYYIVFKKIESLHVNYPSRINPLLKSLKFKFFNGLLYSIEYTAKLKAYEVYRLQNRYYKRFNVKINKKKNSFQTEKGIYFVEINPDTKIIRVIIMGKALYKNLEQYIQNSIEELLIYVLHQVQAKLNVSFNIKKLILQQRKNELKKNLKSIYRRVDEL